MLSITSSQECSIFVIFIEQKRVKSVILSTLGSKTRRSTSPDFVYDRHYEGTMSCYDLGEYDCNRLDIV